MAGVSLLLPDYVDRDLYRRDRSSVFKPVCGVPILGPAHSRPVVRCDSISMVGDRSLQDVDDAWSAFMVVNRAEDSSRLDRHHSHSKLAPCHALELRAKVNGCKQLRPNTLRLRCRLFVAHRALLSVHSRDQRSTQPGFSRSWASSLSGLPSPSAQLQARDARFELRGEARRSEKPSWLGGHSGTLSSLLSSRRAQQTRSRARLKPWYGTRPPTGGVHGLRFGEMRGAR